MNRHAPKQCKYGDPACPCQDGDLRHYEGPNPMTPPLQWYALRLRSNREFQVRDLLTRQGIGVFLPIWEEKVQWADRVKTVERVFFPGYIFVRMAPGPELFAAIATRGVVQVLPSSHKPESIDDKEMDDVSRVVLSKLGARPCEFHAGELVTVDSGPLAGIQGVVVRTNGSVEVVVSIEILRRSVRVKLPADTLLRVSLPVAA